MPLRRMASLLLLMAALVLPLAAQARAQVGSERYSSIVMEAATGNVLLASNPDELRYPASLTKMMTLYMVFEALRDHRIALDQLVPVSPHAASMVPTKLGLVPSTRITVEQAILGLVTLSANDAASALGELLGGGDESRFAQMMTLRARALGMTSTVFRNASGLPDPQQVTTARDLAVLARHLVRDFPEQYRYFSTPSFRFHGRTIMNHDHLLQTYPGADGIKTGYTEASGYNLVTSAVRGDVRLIGVVLGAARPGERDLHMAALLDRGFEELNVPAVARARPPAVVAGWSVWIGTFTREAHARAAAALARGATEGGQVRIEQVSVKGRIQYRAVLSGLSQGDARQACAAVVRRRMACTPIPPESGQVASR